ncbi:MAG TPA: tail fiber domain-containing protein, partial [Ignavibacteria bacterium]|nr:tail fiber domain-containing protein [Ignavibacteria bacterium]
LGLDFITKLHPRQFNWDKREWYDDNISDGSKMKDAPTAGFIAQELDSVQNEFNAPWLKLVLKDNPDKWEATYGNLLPVVVKAVQELKSENDRLKQENETLALEIQKLKDIEQRVAMLEGIFNNEESKEVNNAGR